MENKKMDWSKPLLVELEKATYTIGACNLGKLPGVDDAPCINGKADSSCTPGSAAASTCYIGNSVVAV